MKRRTCPIQFDVLESRLCPALFFSSSYDFDGNLAIVAYPRGGPNDVLFELSADNLLRVSLVDDCLAPVPTIFATTGFLDAAGDVTLTFPNTENRVCYDFNGSTLTGNLTINGGTRRDELTFVDGDPGVIEGDLTLSRFNEMSLFNLTIAKSVTISVIDAPTPPIADVSLDVVLTQIGGSLGFRGAVISDAVTLLTSNVEGQVYLDMGPGELNMFNEDTDSTIGGNVTYRGLNGQDDVVLDGTVLGSVTLLVGHGNNTLTFGESAFVAGKLTMIGGFGDDSIDTFLGTLGGDLTLNFSHGDNNFYFGASAPGTGGRIMGKRITYLGGNGFDDVQFLASSRANGARFDLKLGAGDDLFVLESNEFKRGRVLGEAGLDTFQHLSSPIDFPITLVSVRQ
jgi:hypothetical protein